MYIYIHIRHTHTHTHPQPAWFAVAVTPHVVVWGVRGVWREGNNVSVACFLLTPHVAVWGKDCMLSISVGRSFKNNNGFMMVLSVQFYSSLGCSIGRDLGGKISLFGGGTLIQQGIAPVC